MTDNDEIDKDEREHGAEDALVDTEVEPENAGEVESEAAPVIAPPAKRKRFRFLAPLLGLMIALGAGGAGGFAAHEYFDSPPPAPDLSAFQQDIDALEAQLKTQTARVTKLEGRAKKDAARLARDMSKLEADWQSGLTALDAKIEAVEIPVIPPPVINVVPDVDTAEVAEVETPQGDAQAPAAEAAVEDDVKSDESVAAPPPVEMIIDPRPELLAVVDDLRGAVEDDITAIKARLDRLETQPKPSEDIGQALADVAKFPLDDILAGLKAIDKPDTPQNWWDKVLQKHVSVKRTDYDVAAAILKDIQAAILIGDWEQASLLTEGLPESARPPVQEWIAAARR